MCIYAHLTAWLAPPALKMNGILRCDRALEPASYKVCCTPAGDHPVRLTQQGNSVLLTCNESILFLPILFGQDGWILPGVLFSYHPFIHKQANNIQPSLPNKRGQEQFDFAY